MSMENEGVKSGASDGLGDTSATEQVLSDIGPGARQRFGAGRSKNVDVYSLWPIAVMVLIIIATSFKSSRFLSVYNFENILSQASPLGIVTMGQCILLISGGLDLSVGYNIAFSSIITGLLLEHNASLWLAVLAGIAAATLVGFVNGVLAAQGRAHPFIITLGMSIFLFGLDTQLTGWMDRKPELLDPIEHAVLLIGLFELTAKPEIPYRVAINEAVSLTKRFGATDGHKFVNAVLDRAARELRPHEYGRV